MRKCELSCKNLFIHLIQYFFRNSKYLDISGPHMSNTVVLKDCEMQKQFFLYPNLYLFQFVSFGCYYY
jgi:hypothetical protein